MLRKFFVYNPEFWRFITLRTIATLIQATLCTPVTQLKTVVFLRLSRKAPQHHYLFTVSGQQATTHFGRIHQTMTDNACDNALSPSNSAEISCNTFHGQNLGSEKKSEMVMFNIHSSLHDEPQDALIVLLWCAIFTYCFNLFFFCLLFLQRVFFVFQGNKTDCYTRERESWWLSFQKQLVYHSFAAQLRLINLSEKKPTGDKYIE